MKRLILLLCLCLLVGVVSGDAFSAWSAYGDAWKATNATHTLVMWNQTGSHSWVATGNASSVDYLVVAGGGGGGLSVAGGGGGGGFRSATGLSVSGLVSVEVGAGGVAGTEGVAANGKNSTFYTINSTGGGGGCGSAGVACGSGGSGGGSGYAGETRGSGNIGGYSPSEGNNGGSDGSTSYGGAGGGGAGAVGANSSSPSGAAGGAGRESLITGTSVYYAGGGGGGARTAGSGGGAGGIGGGGAGANTTDSAVAGTAGTGGGGGGNTNTVGTGKAGGSGVVIISYVTGSYAVPVASFTYIPSSGTTPLLVSFADTTTNTPTTWNWSYHGYGTNVTSGIFATTKNPVATFTTGNYTIALNTTNGYGYNLSTQISWINVSVSPIVASFYADNTAILVGQPVTFTDTSTGSPTNWSWSATNTTGTYTFSTAQNPTFTPTATGNYQIQLNASTLSNWYGVPEFNISTQNTVVTVTSFAPTTQMAEHAPIDAADPQYIYLDNANAYEYYALKIADAYPGATTMALRRIEFQSGTGGTYTSQYPPVQSNDYVKAKSQNATFEAYWATTPSTSLTGPSFPNKSWATLIGNTTNQRFHIAYGSPKTMTRIYYENYHTAGTDTRQGLKTVSVWGSNSASAFANLNYTNDTGWTQIETVSTPMMTSIASTTVFANITPVVKTIIMNNVSQAKLVYGNVFIDRGETSAVIESITANTTRYPDLTLSAVDIINSIDDGGPYALFTAERSSGNISGDTPIADVSLLYVSPTTKEISDFNLGAEEGETNYYRVTLTGYRIPLLENPIQSPSLYYKPWVTYSQFSANNTHPYIEQSVVEFVPTEYNKSANRFLWDFGDGTTFLSTNKTGETHIYRNMYPEQLTFSPSLTAYMVENSSITNTTTKTGYIVASYNKSYVNAEFIATPTSGQLGTTVSFTDLSRYGDKNGTVYNWSFGDGWVSATPYSNVVGNVQHVYSTYGTYTVILNVTTPSGNDIEQKLNYIVIGNDPTRSTTTWYVPKTIEFQIIDYAGNQITGATVNATFNSSSTLAGGNADLVNWYGMNPTAANNAANGTLTMTGFSDNQGGIVFTMLSTLNYDVLITYGGTTNYFNVHPQDNSYQLRFLAAVGPDTSLAHCVYANGNTHTGLSAPDAYNMTLMWSYQDTCGLTSSIDYVVKDPDNNSFVVYNYHLTPVTSGVYVNNLTVSNTRGKSYVWYENATRTV